MRPYNQTCSVASALDIVGERWTLLIVRDLLLGPLRYGDLLRGLPGITTNLLAKRLQEMTAARLLERSRLGYQLSVSGQRLEPVIHALGAWAPTVAGPALDALMVALRRRYIGGRQLIAEFAAPQASYRFGLQRHNADITREAAPDAALRVSGKTDALASLFVGSMPGELPNDVAIFRGDWDLLRQVLLSFRRHD